MKRLQNLIKQYFGFTRSETNGFIILIFLMVIFFLAEPVYRVFLHKDPPLVTIVPLHNSVPTERQATQSSPKIQPEPTQKFHFDPNKVGLDSLKLLGFDDKLANRIINFRKNGGRFYQADDLQKIYGMKEEIYEALEPWVQIAKREDFKPGTIQPEAKVSLLPFDLNLADSTQLQSIHGIGPVMSRRIRRYRDALGGFFSPNQLYEVYNLDSAVVGEIKKHAFVDKDFVPVKLNLNKVDERQLSAHPYLTKSEAQMIIMYRRQHGNFTSVDDLKKIHGLKETSLGKFSPYLTVD